MRAAQVGGVRSNGRRRGVTAEHVNAIDDIGEYALWKRRNIALRWQSQTNANHQAGASAVLRNERTSCKRHDGVNDARTLDGQRIDVDEGTVEGRWTEQPHRRERAPPRRRNDVSTTVVELPYERSNLFSVTGLRRRSSAAGTVVVNSWIEGPALFEPSLVCDRVAVPLHDFGRVHDRRVRYRHYPRSEPCLVRVNFENWGSNERECRIRPLRGRRYGLAEGPYRLIHIPHLRDGGVPDRFGEQKVLFAEGARRK